MLTTEQIAELDKPLDAERIKGREGPGRSTLSYLSQDDVKRTANRIFGFTRWSYTPVELVLIGTEPVQRTVTRKVNGQDQKFTENGTRVAYRATVKVWFTDTEGTYTDVGYGEDVSYTSVLQQHELAIKEAVSDAVKRALVALGDQFGLSLYEKAGNAARGRAPAAGRGAQRPSTPPTLNDTDLKAIHAKRNEFDVSEDNLKRIARFCADMPSLTSMKQVPRSSKAMILDALGYFASNPADAEAQLAEFEADAGITSAINDPANAEAGPPRNDADAAAAAGIPDGYE